MSIFEEPGLDAADIQGHVLLGFGGGFQRLVGLRFRNHELPAAKAALRPWAERVTDSLRAARARAARHTARARAAELVGFAAGEAGAATRRAAGMAMLRRALDDGALHVAIAFSAPGLAALGGGAGPDDPLFRAGAAASAFALGDEVDDQGRPLGWVVGADPQTTPDVFIVLAGGAEDRVAAAAEELVSDVAAAMDVVYREAGSRLPGDTEHFGFVDGISQPGVRGDVGGVALTQRLYPADHPLASTHARPGQPLVWPGQFVFGYPTQRIDDPSPGPISGSEDPRLTNGSILVFRRLRQHVPEFHAAMETLAGVFREKGLEVDAATVAAWCVGRWPDGTPVSLSPSGPDDAISGDNTRRNGFGYLTALGPATLNAPGAPEFPGAAADPRGHACPFFAHVRKVNPRDHGVDQGSSGITLRSQMLRRGIPYAGEGDRGLLFLSYQTSIANQFHRLMTLWVNNASAPLGDGIDPLIGAPPPAGRALIRRTDAQSTFKVRLPGRFVTTTGAGYFFTPGIRTLRELLAEPADTR